MRPSEARRRCNIAVFVAILLVAAKYPVKAAGRRLSGHQGIARALLDNSGSGGKLEQCGAAVGLAAIRILYHRLIVTCRAMRRAPTLPPTHLLQFDATAEASAIQDRTRGCRPYDFDMPSCCHQVRMDYAKYSCEAQQQVPTDC